MLDRHVPPGNTGPEPEPYAADQLSPRPRLTDAVKTMVVTDENGRLLFRSPTRPGSCAINTHGRQSVLVKLLADGPTVEILAMSGTRAWARRPAGA